MSCLSRRRRRFPVASAILTLAFVASACGGAGCYSTGDGTAPPPASFYFPVGLAVSRGGDVLYAINSDFDLQWNGGTLQSYDLFHVRRDVLRIMADPTDPNVPIVRRGDGNDGRCPDAPPLYREDNSGLRQPLGETCAPPVDSTKYVCDSVIIGAFATDLQLARGTQDRLFAPVRGNASLTWADVVPDDPKVARSLAEPCLPPDGVPKERSPFKIQCGAEANEGRCDGLHAAGNNEDEPGNVRRLTMPGEPFGMAQSEDGTAIVITHQNDTKASLFKTGLGPARENPSLQFILDGVPGGGNGVVAVPHEPDAFVPCAAQPGGFPCPTAPPQPSFLLTSRAVAEVQLLRYYKDQGVAAADSPLSRPFLVRETAFPISANAGGSDSRGIIIDPSPRIACKLRATTEQDKIACAQTPARVFIANRSPASLLIGEIGRMPQNGAGVYDADLLHLSSSLPLTAGPSRLYLAPIVDAAGELALRLFIVCFDSATIFVYDPDAGRVENVIRVDSGPFAMAFDPFTLEDVALHKRVESDPRWTGLRRYAFAYVASFTNSYVQILDLDASRPATYQRVVFKLGNPTLPKGAR